MPWPRKAECEFSPRIAATIAGAFYGQLWAKMTSVFLARVRPHDAPLLLPGADGPRGLPIRGRSGRGRPLSPRPQPPRVRLPDRLRPAVPSLPGPATPGSLRRAAGLRRHAAEPGPGPDRRLRGTAAHGLGPPAPHPAVPPVDRLRPPTGPGPGAIPFRGVLPPGADRRPVGPRPGVPPGTTRALPLRVGVAAGSRGTEETGPRAHRHEARRGPPAPRGDRPRRPAGSQAGGSALRS